MDELYLLQTHSSPTSRPSSPILLFSVLRIKVRGHCENSVRLEEEEFLGSATNGVNFRIVLSNMEASKGTLATPTCAHVAGVMFTSQSGSLVVN